MVCTKNLNHLHLYLNNNMFARAESCFLQSRHTFSHNGGFEDDINELFNKKFQFRFNKEWTLPPGPSWFSVPIWKINKLESLKARLNFHKSKLNDFNIEEWSAHTRRRNPAGDVGWKVRCQVNPEFLTQAWTKFYECVSTYNFIPNVAILERKLVSLHLCEAPGAFITSLNHYLKLHYAGLEWKWLANTLNPYYEGNSPSFMISDDRFMFHTLDNWEFGTDNTGNLMNWDNSQAIVCKANSLGKVMLVTADGSVDCLQKPDAQEEVTSPLHYCEIVTALQALHCGGTLMVKLFTIFEHSTISLLYILNNLFAEVNIYKPVTSRQGNSEIYTICLNYKGSELIEPYIPIFKSAFGTELYGNFAMLPLEAIPTSFIRQIEECSNYFCSIQCKVINNNLDTYPQNITAHREIKRIRSIVADEFLMRYDLRPLLHSYEILNGVLHEENKLNTNPRYHRGSYTERQSYTYMSSQEKLNSLNYFLQTEVLSNPMILINDAVQWIIHSNCDINISFTYGQPLQRINSSKFIFIPIFKLYLQILDVPEYKDIIIKRIEEASLENSKPIENLDIIFDIELCFPEFDFKEHYSFYEKMCLEGLVSKIKILPIGGSMTVQNFNTLTHFNVGILYILSLSFERTGVTSCGRILLCTLIDKNLLNYLLKIEEECIKVRSKTKDVLNVLPVQVTNTGDFFSNVVLFNNTFYRNKCMQYLDTIQKELVIDQIIN